MELTFTENIKDKTSRLMSTPFSEIVDEATSELLLSPDYGRILMLCDSVNQSGKDYNTDVVRAVRRRIDHKIPKVQYFTVVMVESLIKNCGPAMHAELAETRALQRDLIAIALRDVSRDGEGEAKDVALQLILDCSYWFRAEMATEKTKPLGLMINYITKAKNGNGRALFEGREPDASANINRIEAPKAPRDTPDRNASARARQQRQQPVSRSQFAGQGHYTPGGSANRQPQQQSPPVVDAIPVIPPTEEEISGMMDAVMLLVESLNAADESKCDVVADDMVTAISTEVRSQHRKLSIMISSGAELESMEVLLSITDSQVAVIQRLSLMLKNQGQTTTANRIAEDAGLPAHQEGGPAVQNDPQHQFQQQAPPGVTSHAPVYNSAPHVHEQPPPDIDSLIDQSRQSETFPPQQPVTPPAYSAPPPASAPLAQPVVQQQPVASDPAVNYQPPPPNPYQPEIPVQDTPAPAVAPIPPLATPVTRAVPTIDDLFGDTSPVTTAAPPVVSDNVPAPVQEDAVWGTAPAPAPVGSAPAPLEPVTRTAADIDDEPMHATAPPAVSPHAFPAPSQELNPAMVETNQEEKQEQQEPQVVGSLNGGDDEFDAFLNNRLGA